MHLERPVVAVLQPSYLPWAGAFDMMAAADVWVFYDDVQYTRRDWRNRNRIKGPKGPELLTVPVRKCPIETLIRDVRIHDEEDWAHSHLARLERCYAGCPQRDAVLALLEPLLCSGEQSLAALCMDTTRALARHLGLAPRFVTASELAVEGRGQARVLALCRTLGAASYVNGAAGRALYDESAFAEHGIRLVFHEYDHPTWDQPHPPFASHLSVVDLLMSHAPEEALGILRSGTNLR